jgi:hypothetical protein
VDSEDAGLAVADFGEVTAAGDFGEATAVVAILEAVIIVGGASEEGL